MATETSVYVCKTAQKAEEARQFLIQGGYPAASITVTKTAQFIYDAETFGGGGGFESFSTRWVVIGGQ